MSTGVVAAAAFWVLTSRVLAAVVGVALDLVLPAGSTAVLGAVLGVPTRGTGVTKEALDAGSEGAAATAKAPCFGGAVAATGAAATVSTAGPFCTDDSTPD